MTQQLAHGLIRLRHLGECIPCDYDFETKSIGPIHVSIPLVYTTPYSSAKSIWSEHDLWKYLLNHYDAIATVIVNNYYLCVIFAGYMILYRSRDDPRPQVADTPTRVDFTPDRAVGFVRTIPLVKDVNVPPYFLYADAKGRALVGTSLIQLESPTLSRDMSLYRKLIDTKHKAVYTTAGGYKFI